MSFDLWCCLLSLLTQPPVVDDPIQVSPVVCAVLSAVSKTNEGDEMAYSERTLTCRDCGRSFPFTVEEQQFFAEKGFTNDPTRCPECRAARRAERGGGSRGFGGGGYSREPRQMYPAVCAQCGKETEVPFQPRGDKPVYCSDCYSQMRGSYGRGY